MSVSALMRRMADAGAPIEAIIVAVEALEAEQNRASDAKAKVAQRKRDQRARERDMAVTVTGQSQDIAVTTPFPAPAPFLPPDPQQTPTPTHTPVLGTPARKGTRLAEDWKPEPVIGNAGSMVENWPPGTLGRELEKFRNYWLAKSGKDAAKTNWQRTWINWLMTADERIGRNVAGNRNSTGSRGSVSEALHAARDRLGYS